MMTFHRGGLPFKHALEWMLLSKEGARMLTEISLAKVRGDDFHHGELPGPHLGLARLGAELHFHPTGIWASTPGFFGMETCLLKPPSLVDELLEVEYDCDTYLTKLNIYLICQPQIDRFFVLVIGNLIESELSDCA